MLAETIVHQRRRSMSPIISHRAYQPQVIPSPERVIALDRTMAQYPKRPVIITEPGPHRRSMSALDSMRPLRPKMHRREPSLIKKRNAGNLEGGKAEPNRKDSEKETTAAPKEVFVKAADKKPTQELSLKLTTVGSGTAESPKKPSNTNTPSKE